MKIKREVFGNADARAVWDELCDNYLPSFNDDKRLELDEVSLTFSLLMDMHYQILNGGVMQFLDNGSGAYFHETIAALNRIGYTEFASVLEKIKSHFPNQTVPREMDERRDIIDMLNGIYPVFPDRQFRAIPADLNEWDLPWDDFDERYYDNQPKFYQLIMDYLKSNATLID